MVLNLMYLQVGGRLKTVHIDGNEYEAGGSIIHDKNLYMKRLVEELGMIIFFFNYKRIYEGHYE